MTAEVAGSSHGSCHNSVVRGFDHFDYNMNGCEVHNANLTISGITGSRLSDVFLSIFVGTDTSIENAKGNDGSCMSCNSRATKVESIKNQPFQFQSMDS